MLVKNSSRPNWNRMVDLFRTIPKIYFCGRDKRRVVTSDSKAISYESGGEL